MINLNQREWKAFFIEDHLLINSGKRLTKADMHLGRIPFVGATGLNNGVTSFVSNENESTQANVLGVNYNGSVVETFYHPYRATFSDDVKRVTIKESGANNQYSLLFVKQCLLQQKSKYAYGYKFNAERMRRQKIILPATADGRPDWDFMSAYMRQQEQLMLEQTLPYFKQRLLNNLLVLGVSSETRLGGVKLGDVSLSLPAVTLMGDKADAFGCVTELIRTRYDDLITAIALRAGQLVDRQWRAIRVLDYFDVNKLPGSESNMAALELGEIPLISARKTRNGLNRFVSIPEDREKPGHTITWNKDGDGGAGLAYYQPARFAADSHIFVLYPKETLDRFSVSFVVTLLNRFYGFFGHGRANSISRVTRQKIMLPVTAEGTPDWGFMSAYMCAWEALRLVKQLARFEIEV